MQLAESLNNKFYKRVFSYEKSLQKKEEVSMFDFLMLLKNTNSIRYSTFFRELSKSELKKYVYFYECKKEVYFKINDHILEQVLFINGKLCIRQNPFSFNKHIESFINDPKNYKIFSINTLEVYPSTNKKNNENLYEVGKIKFNCQNKREYNEGEMKIFVKTLTGKTLTIHINKNDTIGYLKKKIAIYAGEPRMQKLVFAGIQLNDDYTLDKYNIKKEATLHLILRLRGGMRHFTSLHLDDNSDFFPIIECFIDKNFVKTNLDIKLCNNNTITFNDLLNVLLNKFKKKKSIHNKKKLDEVSTNKSRKKNKIDDDSKWKMFFQMWKKKREDVSLIKEWNNLESSNNGLEWMDFLWPHIVKDLKYFDLYIDDDYKMKQIYNNMSEKYDEFTTAQNRRLIETTKIEIGEIAPSVKLESNGQETTLKKLSEGKNTVVICGSGT
jgi:ubiquitin-large subunit ribosomal protein L40e